MKTEIIHLELQPNDCTRYKIDVILGYGVVYQNYLVSEHFRNEREELNPISFIVCRAVDAYYNKGGDEEFNKWCRKHKDVYIHSTLKKEITLEEY